MKRRIVQLVVVTESENEEKKALYAIDQFGEPWKRYFNRTEKKIMWNRIEGLPDLEEGELKWPIGESK